MEDYENDAYDQEDLSQESVIEHDEIPRAREDKKNKRLSKTERIRSLLEQERNEKNRYIQEANEAKKNYFNVLKQNEELAGNLTKDRDSLLAISEETYLNDLEYSREINDQQRVRELDEKIFNIRYQRKQIQEIAEQNAIRNIKGGAQDNFQPFNVDDRPIPSADQLNKEILFQEFLQEHPYLDSRNDTSYNASLQSRASQLSSDLAARYTLEGKKDKIMNKEYLADLSDLLQDEVAAIKENYPSSNKREDVDYSTPSRRTVAPVSRSSSSGRTNYSTTGKSNLTSDQESFLSSAARHVKGLDIEDLRRTYEEENRRK